jgi:hypothetical protein
VQFHWTLADLIGDRGQFLRESRQNCTSQKPNTNKYRELIVTRETIFIPGLLLDNRNLCSKRYFVRWQATLLIAHLVVYSAVENLPTNTVKD